MEMALFFGMVLAPRKRSGLGPVRLEPVRQVPHLVFAEPCKRCDGLPTWSGH